MDWGKSLRSTQLVQTHYKTDGPEHGEPATRADFANRKLRTVEKRTTQPNKADDAGDLMGRYADPGHAHLIPAIRIRLESETLLAITQPAEQSDFRELRGAFDFATSLTGNPVRFRVPRTRENKQ